MARIQVDAANGLVEIEASEEALEAATEYAVRLLEQVLAAETKAPTAPSSEATEVVEKSQTSEKSSKGTPGQRKRKRGAGKTKNWQSVPNLLPKEGWEALTQFFQEKVPKTQNEQVAVICRGLAERLDRNGFDGNEIHTAFKTLGKKTPANLTGVLGNMAADGLGHSSDGKFQLDFRGEQLVDHDLPRKSSKDE